MYFAHPILPKLSGSWVIESNGRRLYFAPDPAKKASVASTLPLISMSTPSVKVKEEDNGYRFSEQGDQGLLSDPEDYLEEDESLDMNLADGNQKVWLVKLPRYLAEKWADTQRLSGKRLGTIKIKNDGKQQVKLVLNDNVTDVLDIPKEYDISMLNTHVRNSYVFSESNLKKFKQEYTELAEVPNQPELKDEPEQTTSYSKYYRVLKSGDGEEKKTYIPYVKTIPKKTALIGRICHDCQIVPGRNDPNYKMLLSKRAGISKVPQRPKVTLMKEIPGMTLKGNHNLVFLKTTLRSKSEGRAIRMPKQDLLNLLFKLFEEYEYWSMKGLKERTKQPELYLKESLELIANLIKKGPYTSKYNLKPEYRRLRDAEKAATMDDHAEKPDEDDDDMEDVT